MAASQDTAARKLMVTAVDRETKVGSKLRKNRWSGNYNFHGWWHGWWHTTTVEEQQQKLSRALITSLPARFRWFLKSAGLSCDVKTPKKEDIEFKSKLVKFGALQDLVARHLFPPLSFTAEAGRLKVGLPGVASSCDLWIAGTSGGDSLYFSVNYDEYLKSMDTADEQVRTFAVDAYIAAIVRQNAENPYVPKQPVPSEAEVRACLKEIAQRIDALRKQTALTSYIAADATVHYCLHRSAPGQAALQRLAASRFNAALDGLKTFDSDDDDQLEDQLAERHAASSSSSSSSSSHDFVPTLTMSLRSVTEKPDRAPTKLERRAIHNAEKQFGSTWHAEKSKARDRCRQRDRDSKFQL